MFIFTESNIFYRRIGLALILAQFWLFVFALPPFQAGIWIQTEPVMVALFAAAILNCLWLVCGIAKKWLIPQKMHPIFICLLLWIFWQMLATLGSSIPWRSWFGAGEIGEGAGGYSALLLQFMVICPLWRDLFSRRIILEGAIVSMLAQSLLHWLFPSDQTGLYITGSWEPATWGAYLAFMASPLWMALVAGGFVKSSRGYRIMILVMASVLIISNNLSAIVLFAIAALFSLFMVWLPRRYAGLRRFFYPSRRWRIAAIIGCLLPLAWIAFSNYYTAFNPDGPTVLSKINGPISSRLAFNKVAISTMQHEPSRWLMGDGWGRFSDDLFKYVLVDGITVYQGQHRIPNWDMVNGYAYHPHNQAMEALLALGLPGMVLWFALPIVTLLFMPRRIFWGCAPMLVAQVLVSALWFELPQCLPYQALLWVALSSATFASARDKISRKISLAIPIIIAVGALMAWSTWQQYDAMMYGEKLHAVTASRDFENYNLKWIEQDIWRGGDRLRASAGGFVKILVTQQTVDDDDVKWYAQYMQALRDASVSPHIGARVAATEINMQYVLLLELPFPAFAQLGHETVLALPDSLIRLGKLAPLRDDMSSPYLFNLPDITNGDTKRQIEIVSKILAAQPDNRGALWVLGNLLLNTDDRKSEGQDMLDRAAKANVELVYPAYGSVLGGEL